jgi:hypothetical protein
MISEPDSVALFRGFELFGRPIDLVVEVRSFDVDEVGPRVVALILGERHGERHRQRNDH